MRVFGWTQPLLLLLAAGSSPVTGRVASHSGLQHREVFAGLSIRQTPGIPVVSDNCVKKCSSTTCGLTCSIARRAFPEPILGLEGFEADYPSSANDSTAAHLDKRVFNIAVSSPRLVAPYLDRQIHEIGAEDPQFPRSTLGGLIVYGTDHPKSQSGTFTANQKLQFGTRFVHGCTVVAIISKRAVHLIHFWEVENFDGADTLPSTQFNTYVKGSLEGGGGQSTAVKWDLFNGGKDDETKVVVYTPLKEDVSWDPHGGTSPPLEYQNKVNAIKGIMEAHITNGFEFIVRPYLSLDYEETDEGPQGPGAADAVRGARGVVLFQYDGAGNWRYFVEDYVFKGTSKA